MLPILKHFTSRHRPQRHYLSLFMVVILIVLLPLAWFITRFPRDSQAWYDTDWLYRKQISVDHTKVTGSSAHSNFPMLISITDTNVRDNAQADGYDILFTDENDTKLAHEIETYNSSTGELIAWVKVPSLKHNEATILYMYYGNAGASNQQNVTSVWSDYGMVQHLEETTTGNTDFKDSTSNDNDSTVVNMGAGSDADAIGKINGAVELDGSATDYIRIGTSSSLTPSTGITGSAWFKPNTVDANQTIFVSSHNSSPWYAYYMSLDTDNDLGVEIRNSSGQSGFSGTTNSPVSVGNWYYGTFTWDGTTVRTYLNGSASNTYTGTRTGTLLQSNLSFEISESASDPFDGFVDEVRITSQVRSADWISTEYNNQNSPSTFMSFGGQETQATEALPGTGLHLAFNEGHGPTAYDSLETNNGTVTSATYVDETLCIYGTCLYFDDTDDYVSVSSTIENIRTIEFWYRPISTTDPILQLSSGVEVAISAGVITTTGITSPTIYVDSRPGTNVYQGRWHHVIITTGTPIEVDALEIGRTGATYTRAFIDEFKLYQQNLTQSQIRSAFLARGSDEAAARFGPDRSFLSDGLMAYYRMDESSGSPADNSGYANFLTNNGTTPFNPGRFGNAPTFNGSSTYFSLSATYWQTSTLAFWVKPAAATDYLVNLTSGARVIISSGSLTSTGLSSATTYINGVPGTSLTTDVWQHVTITADSIDADAFEIGRANSSYAASGTQIDEFRLYNRRLNQGEIQQLYGYSPPPLAHYRFDDRYTSPQAVAETPRGGMMVYSTQASNNILYRLMTNSGSWASAAATTIATSTVAGANHRPQSMRIYASPTRNEYILVAFYENTSSPFHDKLIAMVYDGDTDTWGNSQILRDSIAEVGNWTRYFHDGTYLDSSGKFMVVHSREAQSTGDITPRFSIWDGSSWSSVDQPTANINVNPSQIVTRNRPGTDEVMIAFHDSYGADRRISTLYYDGAGTSTSDFTLTTHSTNTGATNHAVHPVVDFAWDTKNPTRGWLVYLNRATSETNPRVDVFTADGTGGGSWGTANSAVGLASGNPREIVATARPDTNELHFCAVNTNNNDLKCFLENDNDTTPTTKNPTNGQLATATDSDGIAIDFGIAFESQNPNRAIAVYSDNTSTPKLKKYDPTTGTNGTWDSSATSLSAISNTLRWSILRSSPYTNDIAILLRDNQASGSIYSVFWNAAAGAVYSSGDRAQTLQSSSSGFNTNTASIDFAWQAYFPREEIDVYDTSTGLNHASATNVLYAPGKFGSGLNFYTPVSHLAIPDASDIDFGAGASFTISAWVRNNGSVVTDEYIFAKSDATDGGYRLYMNESGQICFEIDDDGTWTPDDQVCVGSNLDDGVWRHVSAVKSGNTHLKLFLDGIEAGSDTSIAATGSLSNASDLYIGSFIGGQSGNWNGDIDDVRFYNYDRTSSQITSDMNASHPLGGSPIGSQVIYWKLDELAGSTTNNSVATTPSHAGTITGATWLSSNNCVLNGCLNFSATSHTVTAGDVAFVDSQTEMTWSMWINPQTLATDRTIISKSNHSNQNSFLIRTHGSNSDELNIYIPSSVSDTSNYLTTTNLDLTTSTWQHLAIVYNGNLTASNRLRVYKNGLPIETSITGTIPTAMTSGSTSALRLGNSDISGDESLAMYLDEVKIYAAALDVASIKVDYALGAATAVSLGQDEKANLSGGAGDPPVAYWNLNENTGTTAADRSGNGYTGTLTNTPKWVTGKIGSGVYFNEGGTINAERINIGTGPSTVRSVSFWAKTVIGNFGPFLRLSGTANISIAEVGGDFEISANSFTSPTIYVNGAATNLFPSHNTWHHVVVTTSTAINASAVDLAYNGFSFIEAHLDEVKLYDYVLSPAQIAYEYNGGLPVLHWKLNECTGTTARNSIVSGTLNGTITPGASGQTSAGACDTNANTMWYNGRLGRFGASLNFDGIDDFVDRGATGRTDIYSVSFWAKPTTTTQPILQLASGQDVSLSSGSVSVTGFGSETVYVDGLATTTFPDTNWHHVVVVSSSAITANDVELGRIGSSYYSGQLDDFRIYSYPLTAAQVRNIMNEDGAVRFGP